MTQCNDKNVYLCIQGLRSTTLALSVMLVNDACQIPFSRLPFIACLALRFSYLRARQPEDLQYKR